MILGRCSELKTLILWSAERETSFGMGSCLSMVQSKTSATLESPVGSKAQPQVLAELTETKLNQKAEAGGGRSTEACSLVPKQAALTKALTQQGPNMKEDESTHEASGKAKAAEIRAVQGSRILSKNAIAAAAIKKAASNKLSSAKAEGWDSDSDPDLSQF